jgi:hypothetical protein
MEQITIFKDLYKSNDVPYHVGIDTVLSRLKNSKSKDTVLAIRDSKEESERTSLKKKLPCILFGGSFNRRAIDGLIEHSGLMVLDLDHLDNVNDIKNELKEIPYVLLAFVSPSGNGLKFIVRIPKCTPKEHSQYFIEFQKKYDFLNIDSSGKDVSRVCFESYDPDYYYNPKAEVFEPKINDVGFSISERVPVIPIESEDEKINRIVNFNWSKSMQNGQRNSYVFDLAGAFCEYGVSQFSAINYCLQFQNKDFNSKEIETTVNSAYKSRQFGIKYFEDYKKIDSIKSQMGKSKKEVISNFGIDEDTYAEIKKEVESSQFWTIEENAKGQQKIKVDLLAFKLFLESSGFKKHFPFGSDKPNFVKVKSNKVSETSPDKIKDFVLDYILEEKRLADVWNYFANYSNLFSEKILNMIETIELVTLKDEKEKSFFAFENGILEVSAKSVKMLPYIDIDVFVWENQIIRRNFEISKKTENDYKKFILNISKNTPLAFECAIGYLLSNYKNKIDNRAVILNDEVISDNPEGGTGKGVFIQGVRHFRNTSILDGKTFSEQKSFPYQTISQETNVVVFDDVKKNFNFENIFSLITEGITLERKGKDAIKLNVEDSPKIIITTNYAIKGSGNSHSRRRHELEIAQHYNGKLTPFDEFGRQLFDDWNDADFLAFDNYMVGCVQTYLINGLIEQENAINIKTRHFIAETSQDFYNFMNMEFTDYGMRVGKKEEMARFIAMYADYSANWFTQRLFSIWVEKWAKFKNLSYEYNQSNGWQWFTIGDDINGNSTEDELAF